LSEFGVAYRQMKYVWLLWLALFATPAMAAERVLLVLGDSLSAGFGMPAETGWDTLLQQRLAARPNPWRVVNASVTGDTTAGGVSRLPRLLTLYQPSLVVIELGSNDGLRGFGFAQIRANLERLVELTRAAGAVPLLVGGRLPPNYGAAYADAFHDQFQQVGQQQQVALVPFLMEDVALEPALMQEDGYHPNSAAQPVLLGTVWPRLEPLLQTLEATAVK
jgi:acyl-CoA thioesterase-1